MILPLEPEMCKKSVIIYLFINSVLMRWSARRSWGDIYCEKIVSVKKKTHCGSRILKNHLLCLYYETQNCVAIAGLVQAPYWSFPWHLFWQQCHFKYMKIPNVSAVFCFSLSHMRVILPLSVSSIFSEAVWQFMFLTPFAFVVMLQDAALIDSELCL